MFSIYQQLSQQLYIGPSLLLLLDVDAIEKKRDEDANSLTKIQEIMLAQQQNKIHHKSPEEIQRTRPLKKLEIKTAKFKAYESVQLRASNSQSKEKNPKNSVILPALVKRMINT